MSIPGDHSFNDPVVRRKSQRVQNESWPLRDDKGQHARGINDQPHPIDVTVRVVLEHDGEVFLPGQAVRWNRSHVYVTVSDERVPQQAVWVLARDVRRR
jgi:hypothetical protein